MTQSDLLALFDRLLPYYYLEPLKTPGPGYEYLQAVAKMNARVSEAVAHMGTGNYIGSATGGSYATATVEFYRDNTVFGAVTLLKGTVVGTSDGYLYQTMDDVSFGATDLGPYAVEVQALVRGWNWNKPGPITTASGATVAGSINELRQPVVSAFSANFDPTMQVRQTTDATGGSSPMLDGLGLDRGIARTETFATVGLVRGLATNLAIVLAGTRLKTADGFLYRTLDPVTFQPGDFGPYKVRAVPLIKESQASIDAHGLIAPGVFGIALVKWGSPNPDYTLGVSFTYPRTAYFKESDDSYRARIVGLPLTVTPVALAQLVEQILGPTLRAEGKTWSSREVWDIRYQTAYSETSTGTGALDFPVNQTLNTAEISVSVPPYSSNIFVYDYTPADPLSNRYLAGGQDRGQVVFALPTLSAAQIGAIYPGLVESLNAAKPAGIDLAFVLAP